MKKLTEKITQFIENFKNVHAEARKMGFAYPLKLIYNKNPAKEKDKSIEDREKAVLTFILSNSNMRSKDKKSSEINLRT